MEFGVIGREGESLLEAMQRAGIPVEAPCGGNGTCGKCIIRASSVDLDWKMPETGGSTLSHDTMLVQSCRTRFKRNGQACVYIPDRTLDIVVYFNAPVPDGEPALERKTTVLPEPDLRMVEPGSVHTLIQYGAGDSVHTAIVPEIQGPLLSAAVDIGTTTVAVCILDAETGDVLASGAEANVQKWSGSDVISRIGSSGNAESFERLRDGIRKQITRMLASLAVSKGYQANAVMRIVIAGNPTMLHFWAGIDPAGIAQAPFVPVFTSSFDIPATSVDAGQPFGNACRYILIPSVSAYVGADLVAGAIACGLDRKNENVEPALLLDLGTNGEIMLFARGRIWCCSAAAGPAFEGASIEFGCPSISGAIDHVAILDNNLEVSVIGAGKAVGICGSGLLDSISALLSVEAIDATGRINPLAKGLKPECFTMYKNKPAIILEKSVPIVLTQDDIRQVQLAKAAIAAGIDTLLEEAEIVPADVKKVFLAGGFGSKLDPLSALKIGLLPNCFFGRIEAVGNSSLAGAKIVALRKRAIDACIDLAQRSLAVELSGRPDFAKRFVEAMVFPEIEEK